MVHKSDACDVYAVILVGGKGKRLRPLSTNARPKAFLSITRDRKTMFRRTLDRIRKVVPEKNILIVANKRHAGLVKKDFPGIPKGNMILEPVSRNTASAIALAAFLLKKRPGAGGSVMLISPTDQYIGDNNRFIEIVKEGIGFVRSIRDNIIMAVAVKPRYPATDFGYIELRTSRSVQKYGSVYRVKKFVEKPNAVLAKKYFNCQKYLWNTGAFIFKTDAIIDAIRAYEPRIYNGLNELRNISKIYHKLPDISIDYAVMEKARNLYCVKGDYFWQDMGNFDSLHVILRRESRKFIMRGNKITSIL